MKRIYDTRKLRLPIRLKGWRDGRPAIDSTFYKKSAIKQAIKANLCDRWYLKVTYGRGKTTKGQETLINDGDYYNKKDLLYALACFTSKHEIDDYLENFKI